MHGVVRLRLQTLVGTLVVLSALALGAARADAAIWLAADATGTRGEIGLIVLASSYHTEVTLGEGLGPDARPITQLPLTPAGDDPRRGQVSAGGYKLPWLCERRSRTFWIAGLNPEGDYESAFFSVRTPSCRNRLTLRAPSRARPGRTVALRVTDTFNTGDGEAFLCVRPPGGQDRCSALDLSRGAESERFRLKRRGRWRVELQGTDQRILHKIAVGVRGRGGSNTGNGPTIIATGDSMMQSVDAVLGDKLGEEANIVSQVMVGSGLSKPGVDWIQIARQQVAEHAPAGTVIMLGTNDGFAMPTPAGEVECCDEPWIAEYARRASRMMRIYAQDGAGTVTWMTIPASRDERRLRFYEAINSALERAAEENPDVFLLRADELFTPGGVYSDNAEVNGRTVRVRDTDGLHFSIAGARVISGFILQRLRAVGIL